MGYLASFQHFDADRTGRISRSEFKSGLKRLDLELLDDEVDVLMRKFGNEREIRYADFLRVIAPGHSITEDPIVHQSAKRLRKTIQKKVKETRHMKVPFQHFDLKKKGYFTLPEFRDGLPMLNIRLDEEQQIALFQMLDTDGDGKVHMPEFKIFVGDSTFRDVENLIISALMKASTTWSGKVNHSKTFRSFDTSDKGYITARDFRNGLEDIGLKVSGTTCSSCGALRHEQ